MQVISSREFMLTVRSCFSFVSDEIEQTNCIRLSLHLQVNKFEIDINKKKTLSWHENSHVSPEEKVFTYNFEMKTTVIKCRQKGLSINIFRLYSALSEVCIGKFVA